MHNRKKKMAELEHAALAVVTEPGRVRQALLRLRPLVQCGVVVRVFTDAAAARRWEAEQEELQAAHRLWQAAQRK